MARIAADSAAAIAIGITALIAAAFGAAVAAPAIGAACGEAFAGSALLIAADSPCEVEKEVRGV